MQAKNQAFKFGNDNTDETLAVVCLIWRTDHCVKNTTKNMSESCVHVCVRMQMLRIVQKKQQNHCTGMRKHSLFFIHISFSHS